MKRAVILVGLVACCCFANTQLETGYEFCQRNGKLIVCRYFNYDEHSESDVKLPEITLDCYACWLVFEASKIEVFPTKMFQAWKGLSELKMSECGLKAIEARNFYVHLIDLTVLDLSKNYIRTIPREVFEVLTVLKNLDLSYNQIEDVAPSAFYGAVTLEVVNLRGNRIQEIPRNLFMDLLQLKEVDLSDNKINVYYDDTFAHNTNLQVVRLSKAFEDIRVDLKFLKHLESLKTLDLSRNSLQSFPVGVFSRMTALKQLNLSKAIGGHSLAYGHFTYTKNLEVLDISNNLLPKVETKIFAFLDNLLALYMDRNNFQTIDLANLEYNTQLDVVSLSGNRWYCSFLSSMLKMFSQRKITVDMSRQELERDYENVEGIRCY